MLVAPTKFTSLSSWNRSKVYQGHNTPGANCWHSLETQICHPKVAKKTGKLLLSSDTLQLSCRLLFRHLRNDGMPRCAESDSRRKVKNLSAYFKSICRWYIHNHILYITLYVYIYTWLCILHDCMCIFNIYIYRIIYCNYVFDFISYAFLAESLEMTWTQRLSHHSADQISAGFLKTLKTNTQKKSFVWFIWFMWVKQCHVYHPLGNGLF